MTVVVFHSNPNKTEGKRTFRDATSWTVDERNNLTINGSAGYPVATFISHCWTSVKLDENGDNRLQQALSLLAEVDDGYQDDSWVETKNTLLGTTPQEELEVDSRNS